MEFVNRFIGGGPPADHQTAVKALTYLYPGARPAFTYHEIASPVGTNQLLVKVTHASVNPVDIKTMHTSLTWSAPGEKGLGRDFCGVVAEVGAGLRDAWRVGDRVCGMKRVLVGRGTFATHVTVAAGGADAVAVAPDSLTNAEAAAFPLVLGTALNALSRATLGPGAWVCVLGGTTATGMYAVQLAKHHYNVEGVVVTSSSADLARSLGADEVVNYKEEDVLTGLRRCGRKFRLIVDCVGGTDVLKHHAELLEPRSSGSAYVTLVGDSHNDFHGLGGPLAYSYSPAMVGRKLFGGINYHVESIAPGDWINTAVQLLQAGTVRVVVDSTVDWRRFEDALKKVQEGRAHGKVVLAIEDF
ncbi:hypothetical protein TRICI_002528 [Trichomonascus ciferrii]|uniref:Enoyl reductase (ER) domain-containing protein n=1 Tax=Trichomonascus ciferrii TaxID=44093 RepID=A0A642V6S4_9ASCO|nr:hypothetical protein TRICI_002528 [Trichomonascus ciferrii]